LLWDGVKANSGELLRDTLDMLVLKTLTRGAMHGYAIAEFIEQTTDDVLRVEEGALYPALHRLELRGWWLRSGACPKITAGPDTTG
jgi:PadR family transcriptional regulator PadR